MWMKLNNGVIILEVCIGINFFFSNVFDNWLWVSGKVYRVEGCNV